MKVAFDRHDVFMWLPTGYGKSLCYQALPFMIDSELGLVDTGKNSVVLVISPLIALMVSLLLTGTPRRSSTLEAHRCWMPVVLKKTSRFVS